MSAGELPELTMGSIPEADAARFRVGSCTITVTAGGEVFHASEVATVFADGGLPTCTLALPIGSPVGDASLEDKPANTLARLKKAFKKYAEVSVVVDIAAVESTEDVGGAMLSGKFTIFKGIVGNSRIAHTGITSVSMFVRVVHQFISMSSGACMFSKVVSANGFLDHGTAGRRYADYPAAIGSQPWEVFKETAALLKSTTLNTPKVLEATLTSAAAEVKRIKDGNDRSLEKLKDIKSWADLKFLPDSTGATRRSIADIMNAAVLDTKMSMNLLGASIAAAESLDCAIIFTLDSGYYIPRDPLWSSKDIKVLPAGTVFAQEYTLGTGATGYPELREGYDIMGTLVASSMRATWRGGQRVVEGCQYAVWLIPEADLGSPLALVDQRMLPAWLDPDTLITPGKDKPKDTTVPVVHQASVAATVKEDTAASANTVKLAASVAKDFAFHNTMTKNLQSNSLSLTMALRNDIVPWMNLGVNTKTPDGEDYTVYGCVASVSAFFSASSKAVTLTVELRYVRNEVEQKLIDTENREHYAWKRVAKAINELKLWT